MTSNLSDEEYYRMYGTLTPERIERLLNTVKELEEYDSDPDRAYRDGIEDGYQSGYDEGYQEGLADGRLKGKQYDDEG